LIVLTGVAIATTRPINEKAIVLTKDGDCFVFSIVSTSGCR